MVDNHSKANSPVRPNQGNPGPFRIINGIVIALILVVAGLIGWSLLSEPQAPRTNAERNLAQFEGLIEERPDDPRVQAGMGAALLEIGAYDRAIEHFEAAVKLSAEAKYYTALAEAQIGAGNQKAALTAVRRAQKINKRDARAWFLEGKIFFDDGKYAKAVEPWLESVELEPSAADTHYLLGEALEKTGNTDEALGHYETAIKYLPDYKEALAGLARLKKK